MAQFLYALQQHCCRVRHGFCSLLHCMPAPGNHYSSTALVQGSTAALDCSTTAPQRFNAAAPGPLAQPQPHPDTPLHDPTALLQVRARFQHEPHVYTEFLNVMRGFKVHDMDTQTVSSKISQVKV